MSRFIEDTWKAFRPKLAPNRTAVLVVPSRSYLSELSAHIWKDPEFTKVVQTSASRIKFEFVNAKAIVMVQHPNELRLADWINHMTIGRRDIDLWLMDCIGIGTPVKNQLRNMMAVRSGTFNILVM